MSDLVDEAGVEISVKLVVLQEMHKRLRESIEPLVEFNGNMIQMRKQADAIRDECIAFCEKELFKIINSTDEEDNKNA